MTCPKCKSENTHLNGKSNNKDRLYCKDCGKYSTLNGVEQRFELTPDPTSDYYFKEEGSNGFVQVTTDKEVTCLEDLIRVCKINTEIWEVVKYEQSAYQSHTKLRRFDGQQRIDDEHKTVQLFRVKAYLKLNKPLMQIKSIKDEVLEEIQNHSIIYPAINYPTKKSKVLYEIDIPDLHFGKMSWKEETGADNDIKITESETREVIERAVIQYAVHYNMMFEIEKFLFPIGNDFFNTNSKTNTTVNGTPQDEDTRWQKTFRMARQMVISIIDMLEKIAPVDVVIVPGNHDEERVFYFGELLEAWYRNNPNVDIDNSPKARKYYKYGKNLIGFDHGQDIKADNLPLLMAVEEPQKWAETSYREWHLGHIHTEKLIKYVDMFEKQGIKVRYINSLTPPDFWHYKKGYVGNVRGCQSFLWHQDKGNICQISTNL